MKKLACTTIAISMCLVVATGYAASFDCYRASTYAENAICSDPELSALDDELHSLYSTNMDSSSSTEARKLKKQQMGWLKTRNKCSNKSCLLRAYKKRIIQLGG